LVKRKQEKDSNSLNVDYLIQRLYHKLYSLIPCNKTNKEIITKIIIIFSDLAGSVNSKLELIPARNDENRRNN
jgi:hypothetical protein